MALESATQPGDTVYVEEGTYHQQLDPLLQR